MNDRFKFRTWHRNKMRYIEYFIRNQEYTTISADRGAYYEKLIPNEDIVIMQCTGLKDTQGKRIFEGDIFTSGEYPFTDEGKPNYVGEVVWIDEFANFQYYLHCVNPSKRGISEGINNLLENILCLNDVKIIGNIFENPDLLRRNVNE